MKKRNFASLKNFIKGREFNAAQTLIGLSEGKDGTCHDQPCPFCGGKSRFYFYREKGTFHCRKECEFSGDIIDLVAKAKGISNFEAYDIIAEHVGFDNSTEYSIEQKGISSKPMKQKRYNEHETKHVYRDEDGKVRYRIIRTDYTTDEEGNHPNKSFCPVYQDSTGQTICKEPDVLYPYNLPDVLEAKTVFFVEGEKTADYLNEKLKASGGKTAVATTSQGGAKRGKLWDGFFPRYPSIADKRIIILPDNDKPGMEYARTVASAAFSENPEASVRIVELPDLSGGGDFVDWCVECEKENENMAEEEHANLVMERLVGLCKKTKPITLDDVKAWQQSESSKTASKTFPKSGGIIVPRLIDPSKIENKPIDWLWPGKIPIGNITLIAGLPKQGKSMMTIYMAATVSQGRNWFDGSPCEKGSVIFFAGEDSPEEYARRLKGNGADLSNIRILDGAELFDEASGESKELDVTMRKLDVIEAAIMQTERETGHPVLAVFIDPISNFWGGTRENDNAQVRSVLHPLQQFFQKRKIAPVLIQHLRKSGDCQAMLRITGSVGISGIARNIWAVYMHPEDVAQPGNEKRRCFVYVNSNIPVDPAGLIFKIMPPNGQVKIVDSTTMTADEIEAAQQVVPRGRPADKLTEAKSWLRNYLADGERPAKAIYKAAKESGIQKRTLQTAKKELNIKSDKHGSGEGSYFTWKLPSKSQPSEDT